MRKIISLALVLLLALTSAPLCASAADDNKIYFNAEGWNLEENDKVYCHIWEIGKDSFFTWMSRKEQCQKESDGLYSYDLSILEESTILPGGFKKDADYCLIFACVSGFSTYEVTFGTDCVGDTLKLNGSADYYPVDYGNNASGAEWTANKAKFGPHFSITASGQLAGEFLGTQEKGEQIIGEWLMRSYANQALDNQAEVVVAAMKKLKVKSLDEIGRYVNLRAATDAVGMINSILSVSTDLIRSGETLSLKSGASKKIKLINKVESWKSSDPKTVEVKNGTVWGNRKGKSTVTAKLKSGGTVKFTVKVTSNPKFSAKSVTLKKGATKVITISGAHTVSLAKTTKKTAALAILSSTSNHGKLSAGGKMQISITGLKKGKTTYTVKVNKNAYKIKVCVK